MTINRNIIDLNVGRNAKLAYRDNRDRSYFFLLRSDTNLVVNRRWTPVKKAPVIILFEHNSNEFDE